MSERAHKFCLATIVAAFVILGLGYSVINPVFEAPDELWHFANAKAIWDNKALIVLSGKGLDNPARQEAGQPPFYYLLSAALISWLPTGPIDRVAVLNYDAQPGRTDTTLDRNVVIHDEDENFPYRGVSLAVHLLRAFSILLSVGTILVTYAIAREVFPGSNVIQLGAAAFNAFVPQFAFISASVNNDNLVTLLSSLSILHLVRLAKGDTSARTIWGLGLLFGLVGLTKVSALGLLPLSFTVLFYVWLRRRAPATRVHWSTLENGVNVAARGTLAIMAGFALVSGWWYARNWWLYGDLLGLKVFLQAVERGDGKLDLGRLFAEVGTLTASFWALFGWSNVPVDPYFYWFFDAIFVVAIVGLARGVLTRALRPSPLLSIPLGWLAILIIELVLWASTVGFDVGRLMFPSISAISVLVALGISTLPGRRFAPGMVGLLVAAMFVVAAILPLLYIRPAYKQGLQFVASQRETTRALNVTFGDRVELLGYELNTDVAAPGQSVSVMLYWKPRPALGDGLYRVALDLVSPDRTRSLNPVGGLLTYSNVARRLKETGWLLRTRYEVKIPSDAEHLSHLPIVVRVEYPPSGTLEAFDGLMRPISHEAVVARIRVERPGE
ncbi:MAG: glycosyltransferase family 39 protein [Chloroflexi bacterium]|nr:glycosyltransferase family 39 protein [Chloroflexota bacterium]